MLKCKDITASTKEYLVVSFGMLCMVFFSIIEVSDANLEKNVITDKEVLFISVKKMLFYSSFCTGVD